MNPRASSGHSFPKLAADNEPLPSRPPKRNAKADSRNNDMKIAIITAVFPPYQGGIGNVAYHHALQLKARGYDVTVFTPHYHSNKTKEDSVDGIKVIRVVPFVSFGNAAYVPSMKKELAGFDTIFLHYPFFGGAEFALSFVNINKDSNLFVIYHMDVILSGWKERIVEWYTERYLTRILKAAKKIAVTSFDYAKSSFVRQYYEAHEDKFFEIPNGVDSRHFVPGQKDPDILEKYDLQGKKVILFVGGLDRAHYFKGVEFLLYAFRRVADRAKLMIIGRGDMLEYYRQMAYDFKISDRVVFCNNVSTALLPSYYRTSDVVVLPSINASEAFGMVLIEAMACGKPVIASNMPGIRTVVEHERNGLLVEPKNSDNLSQALLEILSNEAIARSMGILGRKKVEEKYSWEKIGDLLVDILSE